MVGSGLCPPLCGLSCLLSGFWRHLDTPGDLVTHSGLQDSHLAGAVPEALSSVFQIKMIPEYLELERAPLGTQVQLGAISMKMALQRVLSPF